MRLRPYQKDALDHIKSEFSQGKKEVVLAACPSSGKTFMTIQFIKDKFIKDNPNSTFLVLTHGTNVIKDQWGRVFNEHNVLADDASELEESSELNVIYGLPRNFREKLHILNSIDYIVVDEAHHFTFAKDNDTKKTGLVDKIFKRMPNAKRIYLTGTPSKFIRKGYTPYIIPGIDMITQGYISKLQIEVVSTKANFTRSDYNINDELKSKGAKKLEETVNDDMANLMDAMIDRLKEWNKIKAINGIPRMIIGRKGSKLAGAFNAMGKTMIQSASIEHGNLIHDYLKNKSINVVLSESQNDKENQNIKRFQEDESIKVLVVVNRGILGFDMPTLVNVVDLSGSKNIDSIYQLYARAMRKNPANPDQAKFFFKFSDTINMPYNKFVMGASLCLLYKEFISKFNGKNLSDMEVIVKRKKRNTDEDGKDPSGKSKERKTNKKQVIEEDLFEAVLSMDLLEDIPNDPNAYMNTYAKVKFSKIKKHYGHNVKDPEGNKEDLIKWAKSGKQRPSRVSDNPNIRKMGISLISYTSKSQTFDSNFNNLIRKIAPDWFVNSAHQKRDKLLQMAKLGKKRPVKGTILGNALISYTCKTAYAYNEGFDKEVRTLSPSWFIDHRDIAKKKSYDKFVRSLPFYITIKPGQEWTGMRANYVFIDSKYGEFKATPTNLIRNKETQGHPYRAYLKNSRRLKKRSRAVTNGFNVFKSVSSAASEVNRTSGAINSALKRKGKCAGYYWSYAEDE